MKIQCLIERDGVTTVMYNGVRMDFVPNKHGDYICDVCNPGAVDYLLNTFAGKFYREYEAPVDEGFYQDHEGVADEGFYQAPIVEQTVDTEKPMSDNQAAKEFYQSLTNKEDVEKYCLQDFEVNLSRRFSLENMKEQVFAIIDKEYE